MPFPLSFNAPNKQKVKINYINPSEYSKKPTSSCFSKNQVICENNLLKKEDTFSNKVE